MKFGWNLIQHIIFILCEHVAKNENATWVKSEIQDGRQGLIINDKMTILPVDYHDDYNNYKYYYFPIGWEYC